MFFLYLSGPFFLYSFIYALVFSWSPTVLLFFLYLFYEISGWISAIGISKLHLGLNMSIKLNEMLIDAFVVFCRLHGPFEAISYEVTFGRWPFREEKETRLATWRQLGGLYPRPLPLQTGTDAKLELTLRIRSNLNGVGWNMLEKTQFKVELRWHNWDGWRHTCYYYYENLWYVRHFWKENNITRNLDVYASHLSKQK